MRTDVITDRSPSYLALAVLLVIGSVLVGAQGGVLLDQGGILNILTRSTVLGLVAIGQTMVIVTGSLDLSVAYLVGLCSLVAAETMAGRTAMIVPGVLLALGVAAVVGLVNGLVITVLKANAFIATLGVALILRGYLEHNYTGPAGSVPRSVPAPRLRPDRSRPGVGAADAAARRRRRGGSSRRTRTGYHLYAVGGDLDVARLSGVRTARTIVTAHVLCAVDGRPRRGVPGRPARFRRAVRRYGRRVRPGVDRGRRCSAARCWPVAVAVWPARSAAC